MPNLQTFYETLRENYNYPLETLSGCATIDSSNNDNDFLHGARLYSPNILIHSSNAEAINKLLECSHGNIGEVNIIGHGFKGRVNTGLGVSKSTNQVDKFMTVSTIDHWRNILEQLRDKISMLRFWACHTGEGDPGADFLYEVAKIVKVPVAGPTGFVYSSNQPNRFYVEKGQWQIASPTSHPNPIGAPSTYATTLNESILLSDLPNRNVPFHNIISIEYWQTTSQNDDFSTPISLTGQDIYKLLKFIQFDFFFVPGGQPAAMVSAKLVVKFDNGNQEETREFLVYNDLMLCDRATKVFYRLMDKLSNIFAYN